MKFSDIELDQWYEAELLPYVAELRGWLLARYPKLPDVDNLVQDALVRVCRAYSEDEVRSPKALLYTVARNRALDQMRRQKIITFESMTEDAASSVYINDADIRDAVSKQEEIELLAEAIRTLPDRCRQVVTLRTAYGMSQREIAKRLGITQNTVERHMSKGIRRCTEFFARRGLP